MISRLFSLTMMRCSWFMVLSALLLCQGCNKPAVDVSFDQIARKQVKEGTKVMVPLVVLPHTLIKSGEGSGQEHYMLAVGKDSNYYKTLKSVQSSIEELLYLSSDLENLFADDEQYNKIIDSYNAALDTLDTLTKLQIQAVVIELQDFESAQFNEGWDKIQSPFTTTESDTFALLNDPLTTLDDSIQFEDDEIPFDEADADNEAKIDEYNQAVDEAVRKQAMQLPQLLADLYYNLRVITRDCEQGITGKLVESDSIAKGAYQKYFGAITPYMIIEKDDEKWAFGSHFYKTTNLLVSTEPSGLSVTVNGKSVGLSPCLAMELEPGSTVELIISNDKGKTLKEQVALKPEILNMTLAHFKF